MKPRSYIIALIPLLALTLTGCNDLLNSIGLGSEKKKEIHTVLLDLKAIARETGQEEIIKQKLEKNKQEITQKITEAQNNIREKLNEERAKLGKKPNQKQQDEFHQLALQAEQQLKSMQMDAQNQFRQYEATLLLELRNLIQPIAEMIAREKGAQSAQLLNPALVVWHDANIDITNEVIAEINANAAMSESTQDSIAPEAGAKINGTPVMEPENPDATPGATTDTPDTTTSPDAATGSAETTVMPSSAETVIPETAAPKAP